ncbi:hypothetical protein E1B28_000216 [Marasmius oreades]|uniref:Protein kinase domain-containing protein n=1 Tax=Marasmius oreades TaxID=181124 RepID=A0A9P7V0Y0_9AGAR|nr:uncharacterized protein E1B28_000216 [Marasmius oreades]KAG7098254.1 hypothetical protein E1B28_000216 [Marasmius oreades]
MKCSSRGEIGVLQTLQGFKGIPKIGWASGEFKDSIPIGTIDDDASEVLITYWCGCDLREDEVLSQSSLLAIVCNLLEVMASMHRAGFVHGTLSHKMFALTLATKRCF